MDSENMRKYINILNESLKSTVEEKWGVATKCRVRPFKRTFICYSC